MCKHIPEEHNRTRELKRNCIVMPAKPPLIPYTGDCDSWESFVQQLDMESAQLESVAMTDGIW